MKNTTKVKASEVNIFPGKNLPCNKKSEIDPDIGLYEVDYGDKKLVPNDTTQMVTSKCSEKLACAD